MIGLLLENMNQCDIDVLKVEHLNKETLDNLEKSKVYRTDEDGSIMFKIKNNKLKIETCSPQEER